MYRDFLEECTHLVDEPNFAVGYELFRRIAPQWTHVAQLLQHAGATTKQRYLDHASAALLELAQQEKEAMGCLARLGTRSTHAGTHASLALTDVPPASATSQN